MSGITKIEWCDISWNPVVGCTPASEGCRNCYAKALHDMRHKAYLEGKKLPRQYAEPFEKIQLLEDRITQPFSWKKPARVFVNSMSDLFHPDVPDDFIYKVLTTAMCAERHTFIILTKRARRMFQFYLKHQFAVWVNAPNIWHVVSIENQNAANERLGYFLQVPSVVHGVSAEPLLGDLDLRNVRPVEGYESRRIDALQGVTCYDNGGAYQDQQKINWVICGGESGPNARPMHPDWARSLRDQCQAAAIPFFFKQWGEWKPISETNEEECDQYYYPLPENFHGFGTRKCRYENSPIRFDGGEDWYSIDGHPSYLTFRVGKKRAGRLLDGVEWNAFPVDLTPTLP